MVSNVIFAPMFPVVGRAGRASGGVVNSVRSNAGDDMDILYHATNSERMVEPHWQAPCIATTKRAVVQFV